MGRLTAAVAVSVSGMVVTDGRAAAVPVSPVPVTADRETVPVLTTGDSADDPAVWVHPDQPAESLVIGNNKLGALEVYNLDGSLQQRINFGTSFWGNVDVRQSVTVGGTTLDVVAAYNGGLRFYTVNSSREC